MEFNFAMLTDSYKLGHHAMYPRGTETVYSYLESRQGATYSWTVFFGLQYLLKRYFIGQVVTQDMVFEARDFCASHFGDPSIFNERMWQHIVDKHDGRLPLLIRAAPEGMAIPTGNVLMTIENTDPECFALTNHAETVLSQVWYPSTVATLSRKVKGMIGKFMAETGGPVDTQFKLHDFGFRGSTSVESAGIGGMAHLVNFSGTDTVPGITTAMQYYGAKMCGYSVPASEHSVMTSLGREGEREVVRELLRRYPKGILSIVADSYNVFDFCSDILGRQLREEVLARAGVTVVRPDSGDPVTTMLRVLTLLGAAFGTSINDKGFQELNPHVRVLWGDGLNYDKIYDILLAMKGKGWSAANIATLGMGGGLLQGVNRDTQRFAFKSSAQKRNGKWYDVWKDPLDTTKSSKRGRLALALSNSGYETLPEADVSDNQLVPVFVNGALRREWTFDQVRRHALL